MNAGLVDLCACLGDGVLGIAEVVQQSLCLSIDLGSACPPGLVKRAGDPEESLPVEHGWLLRKRRHGPERSSGPCPRKAGSFLAPGHAGALDLDRRDADAVAFLEDLVLCDRLAVHADEVVFRFAVRQTLLEELRDGDALLGLDVVRETAAVVVDEENLHG